MYIQYTCIYSYVYRYIKGGINSAINEVRPPSFHSPLWIHANKAVCSREISNVKRKGRAAELPTIFSDGC